MQFTYGQPRAGNKALSLGITAQGNNYRVTHTTDIVPQLPWESISSLCGSNCESYYHISPEYWISSGLGNNVSTYKVLEGIANYTGNAASGFSPNIVAHLQYFQTSLVRKIWLQRTKAKLILFTVRMRYTNRGIGRSCRLG
jgi:hypothetical protein